jgi:hypothetical protein
MRKTENIPISLNNEVGKSAKVFGSALGLRLQSISSEFSHFSITIGEVRMRKSGDQMTTLESKKSVDIVRLNLTRLQYRALGPLLAKGRLDKKSAILSLVSLSHEPEAGGATAKFNIAWLDRRTATRICRIIREAGKDG